MFFELLSQFQVYLPRGLIVKLQFSRTFVFISTDYGGGPQMVIRPARIYTICERRLAAAGWWLLVETTTFFPIKVLLIVTGLHIPPPRAASTGSDKIRGWLCGCWAAVLSISYCEIKL